MGAEVWGTLAVNDHMRRDALLREILLFDRLVFHSRILARWSRSVKNVTF